jgi:hypothetical protein
MKSPNPATAFNAKKRVRKRRVAGQAYLREAKGIADFEKKMNVVPDFFRLNVLNKAELILDRLKRFPPEQTLVIFPMTSQGGNFYFTQGLLKVLAPKVRVVSLLATGKNEHEKAITAQIKHLLRGRTKVIVFDNKHMGYTEANIRSALLQNGVGRESINYTELAPNKLGEKMSVFITHLKNSSQNRINLLQLNDANLIRLIYSQFNGKRGNREYSNWRVGGKLDVDIFEHVIEKMHLNGLLTKKIISQANLKQIPSLPLPDPHSFIDAVTEERVSSENVLKRVFEVIPKSEIDRAVKRNNEREAVLKRIEYVKGIAVAKELLKKKTA